MSTSFEEREERRELERHEPRPMTLRENVILTVKVLLVSGLIGLCLWAHHVWTSPQ